MDITYHVEGNRMSDISDADLEKFQRWARNTIQTEFPGATVFVLRKPTTQQTIVHDVLTYQQRLHVVDFCSNLLDICPLGFISNPPQMAHGWTART